MIWIPVASIVVFVALWIPTIILGIKRGWKSALFFSLTFLILNVFIICIGLLTYHHGLWDLYRKWFMKKETNTSGIDLNALSASYRPRALLVLSGLLAPVTYGLTTGIYFLLKKPLNRYLVPKVKSIDNNEKEILFRRKLFSTRIAGGVISGTTGFFAASFFASAANAFFTPNENQNGFNKFNDTLGNIYSFGLAGNTNEVKAISQFMRSGSTAFIADIRDIIAFDENGVKVNENSFDESKAKIAAQVEKYFYLFSSDEATKTILTAIARTITSNHFDVLNLSLEGFVDAQTGNKDAREFTSGVLSSLANLKAFVETKNLEDSKLPLNARKILFDNLIASILPYSKSIYVKQYNDWVEEAKNAQNEIDNRNKALKDERIKLAEQLNKQNDLVHTITFNAGYHIGTDPNDKHGNVNVLGNGETDVDRTKARPESQIIKEYQIESSLAQQKTNQETRTNSANRVMLDYERNTWNPASRKVDDAKATLEAKQSLVQQQQNIIDGFNNQISELDRRIRGAIADQEDMTRRYSTLSQMGAKASEDIRQQNIKLNTEASGNQGTLLSAQNELVRLQKISDDLKAEQAKLQTDINNQPNVISRIRNEKAQAESDLRTAKQQLQAAQDQVADAQNKYDGEKAHFSPIDNQLKAYKAEWEAEINKLASITNQYEAQQRKVASLIDDVNNAIREFNDLRPQITTTNKNIDRLNATTSHAFDQNTDVKVWDKNARDAQGHNYDDSSIYAAEQYKKFCDLKVNQTSDIEERLSTSYEDFAEKLRAIFREYTKI